VKSLEQVLMEENRIDLQRRADSFLRIYNWEPEAVESALAEFEVMRGTRALVSMYGFLKWAEQMGMHSEYIADVIITDLVDEQYRSVLLTANFEWFVQNNGEAA